MLFELLSGSSSSGATGAGGSWGTWLMVGVLVLLLVVFMIYNKRAQAKNQKEQAAMLDAIRPGNKVKTIGGICGVVVEICDDGTFVLETGTETSGKSYLKFDRQAVYQTDAVAEKKEEAPVTETPVEETKEEEKIEEKAE